MEEILASIRRIIADDQSLPGHAGPADDGASKTPGGDARDPADAGAQLPPEHGIVSAPQSVSPDGPAGVMDTPHPLAPHQEMDISPPEPPDVHEAALEDLHNEPELAVYEHEHRDQPGHDPQEPPMRDSPAPEAPGLFSASTSQSLAAAFNTLAVSRLAADSHELRGLAQEMLRPLLKEWLDDNLPGMVEGIIRDEIDRMSRRPR